MSERENLHAGHRKRMIDRLMNAPEMLTEHEYLEVLLYAVLPRINTNEVAHRLLRAFGSVDAVFKASPKELCSVKGVGEKVSAHITAVGQIFKVIKMREKKVSYAHSYDEIKKFLSERLGNLKEEKLLLLLLAKNYEIIAEIEYTDKNTSSVTADMPEMANAVAIHKPVYAIIAHNHPSGVAEPSVADDITTMKLNALCSIHGVNLIDHVIVAGERFYGYKTQRRLEVIKEKSNIDKIFSPL